MLRIINDFFFFLKFIFILPFDDIKESVYDYSKKYYVKPESFDKIFIYIFQYLIII